MELKKYVIEIVKNATNQFEYDEHYYFVEVKVIDGKTTIISTGDIWKATKFKDMEYDVEGKAKDMWYRFIKSYYGKRYTVNIIPITLTCTLTY